MAVKNYSVESIKSKPVYYLIIDESGKPSYIEVRMNNKKRLSDGHRRPSRVDRDLHDGPLYANTGTWESSPQRLSIHQDDPFRVSNEKTYSKNIKESLLDMKNRLTSKRRTSRRP